MKRPVRVLRRAERDLLEIQAFVARDDPIAAGRLVDALVEALGRLERFPNRGARPRDERLRRGGYRYLAHGEYLILYKVTRSGVRVYRIVHGRRRYAHLL